MIRVVSGRAEIRGRVTFPLQVDNLTGFPGQADSTDGAICWTIIKYDGVIECCSYPGEMFPVCLYVSLWPPVEPNPPVGPNGEALTGTRAQRNTLSTDRVVGRSAPTSRSTSTPRSVSGPTSQGRLQPVTETLVLLGGGTSSNRIGGGNRNVASHGFVVITPSR
jgi:hypothetical protein